MGWLRFRNRGAAALVTGLAVIVLVMGFWLLGPSHSGGSDKGNNYAAPQEQTPGDTKGLPGEPPKPVTGDTKVQPGEPSKPVTGDTIEQPAEPSKQTPTSQVEVLPAEDVLFTLVERDRLNYFRVGNDYSYWDYKASDKIFYSDPGSNLFVSLTIPEGWAVKREDYQALRSGVRVETASGKPVVFTVGGQDTRGDEDQQVVIHLKDAPRESLNIRFTSKDGKRSKIIGLQFAEEVSYTVRSEQDEGLAKAFRISFPEGVSMPRRIAAAAPYRMQIDFSADMDRGSVEQVLSRQLGNEKWTAQWTGNRSLQLTLEFARSSAGETYPLSMSGARSVQGFELKRNEHVVFIPVQQVEVQSVNFSTQSISSLFTGLDSFETLSVSPNGQWILKGEHVENQLYAEQVYELTDSQGKLIRSFEYSEVGYPGWLSDGNTLIYMMDTLKRQEVWLFNAATGEERLFWRVPQAGSADAAKLQRIVSVSVDPFSGQIAIGAGGFNEQAEISVDVHLFANAQEDKPGRTFENVSRYTCYEGPCTAWIQFISKGKLYFTTMNQQQPQAYPEAFVLDTATGSKLKIDETSRAAGYPQMRQVVPGGDNGVYLRADQQENGSEAWKVYDLGSGTSSEWVADSRLLKHAPFTGFHLDRNGRIVFFAKEQGWYAVDPQKKTITPYTSDLLPKTNEITRLYGSDPTRLWFGTVR